MEKSNKKRHDIWQIETNYLRDRGKIHKSVDCLRLKSLLCQYKVAWGNHCLTITHLCLPASFASVVPECSHTLEVSAWICHLNNKHIKVINRFIFGQKTHLSINILTKAIMYVQYKTLQSKCKGCESFQTLFHKWHVDTNICAMALNMIWRLACINTTRGQSPRNNCDWSNELEIQTYSCFTLVLPQHVGAL